MKNSLFAIKPYKWEGSESLTTPPWAWCVSRSSAALTR
jgi:hypothetical protein